MSQRVVLVRTEGPRNLGTALRAITNFGPAELWVVAPPKPSLLIHPDFVQMSHGVEDAAARIQVVDTLEEALSECTFSVGFSARVRGHRQMLHWHECRGEVKARCADEGEKVALVFGNEVHGLTKEESELCQELVRISTSKEHTSLNLGMAVGIAMHDLFSGEPSPVETKRGEPLVGVDREYLMHHAREVLSGLARSEPIREEMWASCERLFRRAPIETRDARAWHAVLRALGNTKTPADYGLLPGPEQEQASER